MDTTPNLVLPYLAAGQAQKHVTLNEALRMLDAVVQVGVLDRSLTAPPASPAEGDRYIIAAAASGAWAGKTGQIAAFQDGAWAFYAPRKGWLAFVADEGVLLVWNGTAWGSASPQPPALNPAPLIGVNATADATNRLAVSSPYVLFNHAGAGQQTKINKATTGDTASLLYQTGFSGRAEIGLAGDDNLRLKVSADGTLWREALVVDRASGEVQFPLTGAISRPNLLINGDFQINQRGFAGGALSANAYGFDRWKADAAGANLTLSGFIATLASGALVQMVEPAMAGLASFAGTPVTLSLEAPSADMLISFGTASATLSAGTGRRSVTLVPGAGNSGPLALRLAKTNAGTVSFSRLKLELGGNATGWEARPLPVELALCQRYFQASCPPGTNPASYAPGAGNGGVYAQANPGGPSVTLLRFPTPMRAAPNITIRDGLAAGAKIAVFTPSGGWQNGLGFTGLFGINTAGFSLQQANANATLVSFDYTAEAEV